jgi:hypothetical protein
MIMGQTALADTSFTLDNVTDVNGGTYSGSFEFDATTKAISNVDVTVDDSSLPDDPLAFTGSPVDIFCILCSPTSQYDEFRLNAMGLSDTLYTLYLDVADPLNLNGPNPLVPDSSSSNLYSDLDYAGGTVGLVSGSLDATTVPEPGTFALFAAALASLGLLVRLRKAR